MVLPLKNHQSKFEKIASFFVGASRQGAHAENKFYTANKSGLGISFSLGDKHASGYFVCVPYNICPNGSAKKPITNQHGIRALTVQDGQRPVVEFAVVEFIPRKIRARQKRINPKRGRVRMRTLQRKQNARPVSAFPRPKRKSSRRLYDVYINGCRVAVKRLGPKAQKNLANGIFVMSYGMSATYTVNQNGGLKETNIPQSIRKFCISRLAPRQFGLGANHR